MIVLRFLTDRLSLESALIRFGTRGWTSHVEFYDDQTELTLGSRLEGGVQYRPYGYCKPTREEWWTAPGIEEAHKVAISVIGATYDFKDILGFAFDRDWHTPGSYICSALVDAAFKKAGFPLTNLWQPIHRTSPRDLLVSPLVQRVVAGQKK